MLRTVSLLQFCGALALATATGCLATPDDISDEQARSNEEAPSDEIDSDEIESTSQALSVGDNTYRWQKGWAAIKMRATNTHFCYLTTVQGAFRGAGEWVHVFGQNGFWYLNGSSGVDAGLSANAHCVPLTFEGRTYGYTGGKWWSQGQAAQQLASANGSTACVLTYVSGKFDGAGEVVRTYISNGNWYLGGSSGTRDVSAYARCITGLAGFSTYNWTEDDPYPHKTTMELTTTHACGLSRMTGQFRGDGELIAVSQSGGSYFLTGTSGTRDVAATARCFR